MGYVYNIYIRARARAHTHTHTQEDAGRCDQVRFRDKGLGMRELRVYITYNDTYNDTYKDTYKDTLVRVEGVDLRF